MNMFFVKEGDSIMGQKSAEKSKLTKTAWVIIILLFLLTVISNADKAIIGFASVPIIDELGLERRAMGISRQCLLSIIFDFSNSRWDAC